MIFLLLNIYSQQHFNCLDQRPLMPFCLLLLYVWGNQSNWLHSQCPGHRMNWCVTVTRTDLCIPDEVIDRFQCHHFLFRSLVCVLSTFLSISYLCWRFNHKKKSLFTVAFATSAHLYCHFLQISKGRKRFIYIGMFFFSRVEIP